MTFKNGHALIIGVGEYQHISFANVPIAAKDADEIKSVLADSQHCGYPDAQVTLLRNEQATRQAVLAALDELAGKLGEDDTLFLFFVGHGQYGTDGNYYLTTHDTRLKGNRVKAETGVSEGELVDRLRKVKAKRLLMAINACHSGALSPHLGLDNEAASSFEAQNPPEKLTTALLSTGEGRIIITACRPDQKSWIGSGALSIFSQAVVDGLKGNGMYMQPRGGYVSAFNLYEQVYFAAKAGAEKLTPQQIQEPELTVLRGVGPFPVALFKGATDLANFDLGEELPADTAVHEVDAALSQRVFQNSYVAHLEGDGAIAQGEGAKAVGKGGVMVGGNVSGSNIVTGDDNTVPRLPGDATTDAPSPEEE